MNQKALKRQNNQHVQPIFQDEVQCWINAPPEAVYEMISDVTRIGEFSPECYQAEWLDGAIGPTKGARFRGYNRYKGNEWSRTAVILTASPGVEFVFQTEPQGFYQDSNIWRYEFVEQNNGTLLIESYRTVSSSFWMRLMEKVFGRKQAMREGMLQTVAQIKAVAERVDQR